MRSAIARLRRWPSCRMWRLRLMSVLAVLAIQASQLAAQPRVPRQPEATFATVRDVLDEKIAFGFERNYAERGWNTVKNWANELREELFRAYPDLAWGVVIFRTQSAPDFLQRHPLDAWITLGDACNVPQPPKDCRAQGSAFTFSYAWELEPTPHVSRQGNTVQGAALYLPQSQLSLLTINASYFDSCARIFTVHCARYGDINNNTRRFRDPLPEDPLRRISECIVTEMAKSASCTTPRAALTYGAYAGFSAPNGKVTIYELDHRQGLHESLGKIMIFILP